MEPICVASRILWLSPPESEEVARSRDRYSRPTSRRKDTLSLSSFNISRAMVFSLALNFPSSESSHSFNAEISIADTSDIVFPSILKYSVSMFRRVPWHTGHTTLSGISSTIPGNATISDEAPSPTRKSSSEPKTIRGITSSGISLMGSYREKSYLRAMERIISNFLVSLTFPNGTIPPSAMDMLLSGTIVSMFTSTIIPNPLQCGQYPCGELKENECGAGSARESPVSGQTRCFE